MINNLPKIPWNKGQKMPEEQKRKISQSRKGKNIGNKICVGRVPWNKGKTNIYSEEYRKKLSDAKKGKYTGSKSWNWRGIEPAINLIRKSFRYVEWRQNVFMRDDFTCQTCGVRGGDIEAHHKKSFKCLLEEVKQNLPLIDLYNGAMIYSPMWDLSNGVTLCIGCHKKTFKIR